MQPAYVAAKEVLDMLWAIAVLLLLLWLGGFAFSVGGSLIHLLLVLAVIVVIYNLVMSRGRTAV